MNNLFDYFTRVKFDEKDLESVLETIVSDYKFAPIKTYHVIETGYEDFNVYLETLNNKYVVKFFSNERTMDNITHYIKIVDLITKQDYLNIPKVYRNSNGTLGKLVFNGKEIYYFVMEYINGKTIYDLDKDVDLRTIIKIVFDILKYNCVNRELKDYLNSEEAKKFKQYDMWSYENFLKEYQDKKQYLTEEDNALIKPIVDYYEDMVNRYKKYGEKFKNMPVMPPYMSAHNDFISTNIILKDNKEPYYIDFSVSSVALNFVDIAIFGCDTVLKKGITPEEYAKYLRIISYILYRTHIMEYNLYPTAVSVQHAIHILIANYYKVHDHIDSTENDYFLNLGRMGIKYIGQQGLINKPVFNWVKTGDWYERSELSDVSEYSIIKKEIEDLGLSDFIEENVKEYFKLYNRNKTDEGYSNVKLDDLYHKGYDWLYSCIDNVKSGEIVMAISFCNENEWNGEKEENLWTKLNMEALGRNVLMKRIFVYPDNKKSLVTNNRDISKFVSYTGSNLELGFISDSRIREVLQEELNEIYPGVLVFNDDLAFIDNENDPENRGYNVFDKGKINRYYKIYEKVKANCDK